MAHQNIVYSEYLKDLLKNSQDVGQRYLAKICNFECDPYTLLDEDLSYELDKFPKVTYADIYSYLVLSHSYYTHQQLKAYKSLDAYKYFEARFIDKVGVKVFPDCCLVIGKVKHSQRLREAPLHTWIILKKDGAVLCAHCTCMAGTGEVCSHVGAILFHIEHFKQDESELACTDVQCQWLAPSISTKDLMVPVQDVEWRYVCHAEQPKYEFVPPTSVSSFLQKLNSRDCSTSLMRCVEPYASEIAATLNKKMKNIFNIYDESLQNMSYDALIEHGKTLDFTMSDEDCEFIKKRTIKQRQSPEWQNQRAGRITASKFRAVTRTKVEKPSLSLLKQICYPVQSQFFSKSTAWGINNEKKAIQKYVQDMKEKHTNFSFRESGLTIVKEVPQFGASPDGHVSCSCCGSGCLEIKCPYILSGDMDLTTFSKLKGSCLSETNGVLHLDTDHSYYYQVQAQIFLSKSKYADFVVWSPKNDLFVERIFPNLSFWLEHSKTAANFHKKVVIPELLAKFFTKQTNTHQTWCICAGLDDGQSMIKCDADNCKIGWYHLSCMNLTSIPEVFICNLCENKDN